MTQRSERQRALPLEERNLNRCWEEPGFVAGSHEIPKVTSAEPGSWKQEVISVLGLTREELESDSSSKESENWEQNEMGGRKSAELGERKQLASQAEESQRIEAGAPGPKYCCLGAEAWICLLWAKWQEPGVTEDTRVQRRHRSGIERPPRWAIPLSPAGRKQSWVPPYCPCSWEGDSRQLS